MHKGKAKVKYYTNWVIAECDEGLLDYYRWWIHKQTGIWMFKPKSGAHISIVRGDVEFGNWVRNMDGEIIEFNYNCNLECHDNYVWLPVWGKDLEDIRFKLGLSVVPKKPFHMSVGNVTKDKAKFINMAFK